MSFDEDTAIKFSSAAIRACGKLAQNVDGDSHDVVHALSETVAVAKVITTCSADTNLNLMTNSITTMAWCASKRSSHFPLAFQVRICVISCDIYNIYESLYYLLFSVNTFQN